MSNIKTEACVRKTAEQRCHLNCGPAHGLSLVAVFDKEFIAKIEPQRIAEDDVRMKDDGPSSLGKSSKQGSNSSFVYLRKLARGMDGNVTISRKVKVVCCLG